MSRVVLLLVLALALAPSRQLRSEEESADPASPAVESVAERLVASIGDPALRALIEEALARNPGLQAAAAEVRAASRRTEGVRGFPDPTAVVTAFLETPETRVGPQELTASVTQTGGVVDGSLSV